MVHTGIEYTHGNSNIHNATLGRLLRDQGEQLVYEVMSCYSNSHFIFSYIYVDL